MKKPSGIPTKELRGPLGTTVISNHIRSVPAWVTSVVASGAGSPHCLVRAENKGDTRAWLMQERPRKQ